MSKTDEGNITTFTYKNHKGVIRERRVRISSLDYFFQPNERFGYQPGWFITGIDIDKGETRSFALSHIQFSGYEKNLYMFRIPL